MNSIIIFGLLVGSLAIGINATPGHCHGSSSSYGHHQHHDDCCYPTTSYKEDKIREKDLERFINNQDSIIKNGEPGINLTLAKGTKLQEERTWYNTKGFYNGHPVAIRIFRDKRPFKYEIEVLSKLNKKADQKHGASSSRSSSASIDVEAIGVPKVYFDGIVLENYNAIATTLLEETLESYVTRCRKENEFSESNLLEIFKQAVEILKFFKQKKFVHGAITPTTIFLKDSKVFIGDIQYDGIYNTERMYRSSRYWMKHTPSNEHRDDFESLVYSIWHVAGIKKDTKLTGKRPEGEVLAKCLAKERESAIEKIKEKLKHFQIEEVRKAFEMICTNEMLPEGNNEPNYDTVIQISKRAIDNSDPEERKKSKARNPDYDVRFV